MASGLNDSIPPYNEDAEIAVLGALLLNFSVDILDEVQKYIKADDFFKNAHQLIFRSICTLNNKGEGIDILTITNALVANGQLEKVGGESYIAALPAKVPTIANISYYAKIVQQMGARRELLGVSHEIISKANDDSRDYREVLEEAEGLLFSLNDNREQSELKPVSDIIPRAVQYVETRSKSRNEFSGIPSGFNDLDSLTNGFQESELIIIGARPSIGKTALALSMAVNIAVKSPIVPCGFFSAEMSDLSIMLRILASLSRVNAHRLRSGILNNNELERIVEAANLIHDKPLIFQDTPNIHLLNLRSQARRMVLKHGVKIIFVDYIGLITPEDTRQPRHEQVSAISRSLKALARELNVPIVALSQVGRESEGKAPSLASLRESGALEQDADVVLLLHRERLNPDEDNKSSVKETKLYIAKQRNGPIGEIKLAFLETFSNFANISFNK